MRSDLLSSSMLKFRGHHFAQDTLGMDAPGSCILQQALGCIISCLTNTWLQYISHHILSSNSKFPHQIRPLVRASMLWDAISSSAFPHNARNPLFHLLEAA